MLLHASKRDPGTITHTHRIIVQLQNFNLQWIQW